MENFADQYTPCESYRIDRNSNAADAGDLSFNWQNSYYFPAQDEQSMAAVFTAKSAQGKQPYYHDYIYVNFMLDYSYTYPEAGGHTAGCASTDRDANC